MKRSEIRVGGLYRAKVGANVTTVRVDAVRGGFDHRDKSTTLYDVTNLTTGRKTTFYSTLKFRNEVRAEDTAAVVEAAVSSDPTPAPARPATASAAPAASASTLPLSPDAAAAPPAAPPADAASSADAAVPAEPSPLTRLLRNAADKVAEDNAGPPHLIVEARAGTGKTTTLVEGLKRMRGPESRLTPSPQQAAVWDAMAESKDAKSVCFVAFNKSIAAELQQRVPPGCEAMTLHSMGFKTVMAAFPQLRGRRINDFRTRDIIAELLGRDGQELGRDPAWLPVLQAAEKLVGLCKANLAGAGLAADDPEWAEVLAGLAAHYDVELNGQRGQVFGLVPKVLAAARDPNRGGMIDFDDMIWLPAALGLAMTRHDLLLVDEAQDLNRCQQALAKRAGRRLILCGDPRQAIYGFAGADAESMPRMAAELGATPRGCRTLPLTVTRRCGKVIVREANRWVPDFEAFETNPAGTISFARYGEKSPAVAPNLAPAGPGLHPDGHARMLYDNWVQDGDFILCRVNAPLVSQCFRFLKAGRKATIQGRDIGAGLISTVKKSKVRTAAELVGWLSDWLAGETAKENARRNPSEQRLIALQDRHDCLVCFAEGAETVEEVIGKIGAVFTDDKSKPGIRLSSIHKAKGLEARRVFFLRPEGAGCPHPMARTPWQREQENNLCYVAVTRAIEELVYVS